MANIAIELNLGARPGKQNEKEIMVFMAEIWFQKDIFAKLYFKKKKHRTNNRMQAFEAPNDKLTTNS